MPEDEINYWYIEERSDKDTGTWQYTACGGFNPLDKNIVENKEIIQLNLTGDRYFASNGENEHLGSNGWPKNMKILKMVECCNLYISHIYSDTMETFIIPLTPNQFGTNVTILESYFDDRIEFYEFVLNSQNDNNHDSSEVLQWMPNLSQVIFECSRTCCNTGLVLQELGEDFLGDDFKDFYGESIICWILEHSFWSEYRKRGYKIERNDAESKSGHLVIQLSI